MPSSTTTEAVPYPIGTDGGNPRTLQDMALRADALFGAWDAAFSAAVRPKSFLVRSTANSSSVGSNSGSVLVPFNTFEWNTAGVTITAGGLINQALTDPVARWRALLYLPVSNSSGTPTASAEVFGKLTVITTDTLSGVTAQTVYQETFMETTVSAHGVVDVTFSMYQGVMFGQMGHSDPGAADQKQVLAGARMLCWQLGTL